MPIQYESIMTFESKSSKTGKCYTVKRRLDTGAISCDCPQWVFNRNGDRTCYHTERVKVLEANANPAYMPPEQPVAYMYMPGTLSLAGVDFLDSIPEQPTRKVSVPNEGPVVERPRQLRMKEKEE